MGYQIRLDRVVSAKTRIRFVTEGVLLRQMLADPRLSGISALVFDEFHERHLYGDITLARALDLQATHRPDLLVIVMSATLETARLGDYMAPCQTLTSDGRMHPVQMEYLDKPVRAEDYAVWDLAAAEIDRLARKTEGDFLVFMPGAYEISRTVSAVRSLKHDFIVLPLHGDLPPAEQDAAVARYSQRKVVVSTNVAETSLTIDGIRIVIDSGLAKIARFDANRGINTLLVEKISRASADQRAGRAGRTAPGLCLRLWSENEHALRAPQELPEVRRLDLSEVVLTLKAAGITDVRGFRWLEAPDAKALDRAETLLCDLGAIESGDDGAITELGRRLLAFPLHPRYGRMLLEAEKLGCVRPVALAAALTQGRSLLRRAEGKAMEEMREDVLGEKASSDLFVLMRAWQFAEKNRFDVQRCRQIGVHAGAAREAGQLFDQFLKIAKDEGLNIEPREVSDEALQRCVLAAFSDQLAVRLDRGTLRCGLVHGRRGVLARESVVQHDPLFVAGEIRELELKGELTTLLTLATAVREEWLRELFPADFTECKEAFYDTLQKRVAARSVVRFRDLTLRSEVGGVPDRAAAAAVLAEQVRTGLCKLEQWDEAVEHWIARANRLREWMPELELPLIDDEARELLTEQLCHGSMTARDLREKPVLGTVKSWLSKMQQDLVEKFAPERVELPNGKKWRIQYDPAAAPVIAAKIQELYGLEGSLTIAAGRVPLVIQILAPNQRPVQVTSNLSNFWKEAYPKLKIELQRKYPRHEWR